LASSRPPPVSSENYAPSAPMERTRKPDTLMSNGRPSGRLRATPAHRKMWCEPAKQAASPPGPATGDLLRRGAWCDAKRRLHLRHHRMGEPGLAQLVEIIRDDLLPALAPQTFPLVHQIDGPHLAGALEEHQRVGAVAVDPDELGRKPLRALRSGEPLLEF